MDYAPRFRLVFSICEDANGDDEAFSCFRDEEIVITADAFDASLQVVDMMGRVIGAYSGHIRCVPATGIASGVYVLSLRRGDDVKPQKIIVR